MRIVNQETRLVPIDSIEPHPRNVNHSDVGAIHESVDVNGFYGSVLVQKSSGYIIAGSHRWQVAKQQGASALPATIADVDDDTAIRIMLADNRTARRGADDAQALATLLADLADGPDSLNGTGFDGDDLDTLLEDLKASDPAPSLTAQAERAASRPTERDTEVCETCGRRCLTADTSTGQE